jgi:hypothetical protein
MDVLQFVRSGDIDPLLFESSYYVAPEEKVSKPYALFMAALAETKQYAIAKVAMHDREHVVLIRPAGGGLVLHTLYYEDELHKANKAEARFEKLAHNGLAGRGQVRRAPHSLDAAPGGLCAQTKFSAKELEMAKSLGQHLSGKFNWRTSTIPIGKTCCGWWRKNRRARKSRPSNSRGKRR